ncbi:MAG: tRNA (N(6)-L-threonylcarbamoyladenosine(37)-C(2))-methylthiotransferase MtaB [Epulopiscium sp. Nuni2H_MBin003]|nr:MAG: tRNA (N(6)-L-threonylcarbamoyladenosine(37)-C(2))-methylthiotransferase MtaB [Epulopiscium sp. Nuni2H_MBin003]
MILENKNKSIATYTLGCKVNQYDTEAVTELFTNRGYHSVSFDTVADVYIVNTCTVTHLSDRKCRQMLRKTKKINPDSILVAMGCYAQSAKEKLIDEVPEIDIVIGTNKRSELVNIVEEYNSTAIFRLNDLETVDEFEEMTLSSANSKTRAHIKIQEGCNNYCAYCIIPYVRGKIRSRQPENVILEAIRLQKAGFKEIVLTGIHVQSYGKDLEGVNLLTLLPELNKIDGIERIRLSSIEPTLITDEFIDTISNLPKLCHHFHLSLQSGCDVILKRMGRKYNTQQYIYSVDKLRSLWPDVAITTDIIVGFPGESETDFTKTVNFVKEIGFASMHIFPFSSRTGTRAATMSNQISANIKEDRVKVLTELADKMHNQFLQNMCNTTTNVLFEQSNNAEFIGYTSNYAKVSVKSDVDLTNKIVNVNLKEIQSNKLIGTIVE